MALLGQYFHVR